MIGNPKLREESANITNFDNQLKKVIYYNSNEEEIIMVNSKIIWKSKEMFDVWDSCFSFDVAFFVNIERHKKIKVKYQDEKK